METGGCITLNSLTHVNKYHIFSYIWSINSPYKHKQHENRRDEQFGKGEDEQKRVDREEGVMEGEYDQSL